jgi:CRP-like cAMP-binding protein
LLRHVEQLDSMINANATLKSVQTSSRQPSRNQKQIMGYLEKKARTALKTDMDLEATNNGIDQDEDTAVSASASSAPSTTHGNSRKVHPQLESKLETIGSGDLSDKGDFKSPDASLRGKSMRKSFAERLSSLVLDDPEGRHSVASSSMPGQRKSSRLDSRRRSSVTASIIEDVSKFKQTVSRMFEKASQIKLDDERSARVAELVDSEVMVLNASQLAQSQKRKAHQFTISIHSTFRHWWDFIITASIAYVIVTTPLKVGFDVQSSGLNYALDIVVDVIYLIEMVLNFFTSYEDDATGEEIKDLDKIRRNYIQSWFLVDAVSSFPSSLVGTTNGLLTLSKILKVARVAKVSESGLVRAVSGHIDRSMNPSMLRMLKLTVIFLVSQHLIACTYYYISLNQSVDTTWSPTYEIRNSDSLGQQYVDAFYFAIMVTTANDVNPTSPIEKLFTSVMLFVGIVINASIIGSAANLLANLDKEEIARKNQMDSINDYLRFKKVPLNLQNKIRRYYDYALTTRLQDPTENLFADLPDRLKLLLKLNLHAEFVRKVPLFRALSHSGVVAIIQCLVPIVAMPGEIIIVCGEVASEFYFIKTGQVSLCVPGLADSIPLGNLGEGSFFGETSLLTGEPTTAEIKAERVCELMYLSKGDFEAIVDRFPTFFLAVRRISESRMQTAQNIQKMSKMNRRPTQMFKNKKLSFRSVAQAAVIKARFGDHLETLTSKGTSGRSEGRVGSFVGAGRKLTLSTGRRKPIPSFSANFIERLSLAQARHLTRLSSMRDMQQNTEEDIFWD